MDRRKNGFFIKNRKNPEGWITEKPFTQSLGKILKIGKKTRGQQRSHSSGVLREKFLFYYKKWKNPDDWTTERKPFTQRALAKRGIPAAAPFRKGCRL